MFKVYTYIKRVLYTIWVSLLETYHLYHPVPILKESKKYIKDCMLEMVECHFYFEKGLAKTPRFINMIMWFVYLALIAIGAGYFSNFMIVLYGL